jgi:hypothetical protein
MKKAVITTNDKGEIISLDWTDESGKSDFLLSKRGIAIKMAELIVLGYVITTVAYNAV